MEEVVSLILHGCMLVKGLEECLPNIANQPHFLMSACDEISRAFGDVSARLSVPVQDYGQRHHEAPHATDMVPHELAFHQHGHGMEAIVGQDLGGGQSVETDHVARCSTLKQTRKRKHEAVRRTFRVRTDASRMRNTDVPPEDGYTWRKYGQKEILGSKFLRGYYRCTHQKLNNCPAKKQVQRLDNDPYTIEVAYRGDHMCTMSSIAPPPPSEAMTSCFPLASQCLPQLLFKDVKELDIKESSGDLYDITHNCMRPYRNQPDIVNGSGSSSLANYVDRSRVTNLVDTLSSHDN